MSETDERQPMLEEAAETATESPVQCSETEPPEAKTTPAEIASEPEIITDSAEPKSEATNHTDVNIHAEDTPPAPQTTVQGDAPPIPLTTPGGDKPATEDVDDPIKPPRLKSMRSKEGSPYLKAQEAQAVAEVKDTDIEAVAKVGEGPEPPPYEATTAPLQVRQDAVKPRKKIDLDYILEHKWILLGIIAIILLILIIIIVGVTVSRPRKLPPTPPQVYPDPEVSGLSCGKALGEWELNNTVAVFKGIPYLKPPVGENRWTYDLEIRQPEDCVNATHAKEFKGPCVQLSDLSAYAGTEDCLYLNIWAPSSPDEKLIREEGNQLPVLVYIHGGFLHYGSGHEELLSTAAQLASELNAIIVSFNYRLNVFGWMALENLVPGSGKMSGNFGLYDQISALKWVSEYIASFGGDPNKVTVSGLSSGGTSVLALLTNSDAKKTFQRAWISGAASKFDGPKEETMRENTDVYLRNVGCSDMKDNPRQCLLSKTKEELIDAIPWLQYPSWGAMDLMEPPTKDLFIGGVLINDEQFIQMAPDVYLQEHSSNLSIPILIGNSEYETDMYQVVPVSTWSWGQYSDYVRSKYDTFNTSISETVLNDYASELSHSPRLHMSRHVSDVRAICPQTFISDLITTHTASSVYRYVNTVNVSQATGDKYFYGKTVATHGSDFVMLFDYSDDENEAYKETQMNFRSVIKEFMMTGAIGTWDTFPSVYKISSTQTTNTSRWTMGSCEFWKSFYPKYSWMN